MRIADNVAVFIHYTLTDDEGVVIDSSEGDEPLGYLHGQGNIIPGLEKALVGKQVGDKLDVVVTPEEGYGVYDDDLLEVVPRSTFKGIKKLEPGMEFQARSDEGEQMYTVVSIEGDEVTIDGNHPLAGETLHFQVEITDVREATAEELEHGHVHDGDGHEH